MKGSKLTQGVCSCLSLLMDWCITLLLSVDAVLPPHLLLWDLPKTLLMHPKFPECVGVLCTQGSACFAALQNLGLFSMLEVEACKMQI